MVAGASQVVVIDLMGDGVAAAIVFAAALVTCARYVMYSAAMVPAFSEFSWAWRYGGSVLLGDQRFALAVIRFREIAYPGYRRFYYLGSGVTTWTLRVITTSLGVFLGSTIPTAWNLGFAVPLVFVALSFRAVTSRPGVAAAVVGGTVSVIAIDLPNGLGIFLGTAAGIVAGIAADRG